MIRRIYDNEPINPKSPTGDIGALQDYLREEGYMLDIFGWIRDDPKRETSTYGIMDLNFNDLEVIVYHIVARPIERCVLVLAGNKDKVREVEEVIKRVGS